MQNSIKKSLVSLTIFLLATSTGFAQSSPPKTGFSNESEAGLVITTGNTETSTFNFTQTNAYSWDLNLLKFNGKALRSATSGAVTAKYFLLGLRFERTLNESLSAFLGQSVEGDPYAGYFQRYSSDAGLKYFIVKTEEFQWVSEGGYRYSYENRVDGKRIKNQLARIYLEAMKQFGKEVSMKYWVEYLPNFTNSLDYMVNSELSISAMLNSVLSLKTAYLVRFDHEPTLGKEKTDSTLTTSLVAKF